MSAEFAMSMKDCRIAAEVNCVAADDMCPNQSDLRDALHRLLHTLNNWEHVDITIRTVEKE